MAVDDLPSGNGFRERWLMDTVKDHGDRIDRLESRWDRLSGAAIIGAILAGLAAVASIAGLVVR